MDLFSAPQSQAARQTPVHSFSGVRQPHWEERPAWAQPTTSWPFRVIDPQSHRIGGSEPVASPGWSS